MTANAKIEVLTPEFDRLFSEYDRPRTPGASVLVIRNGNVVFARGYGLANVENEIACTTTTNFRLASVTKQFTAMAILMLVERKKVSLEDPIADFFPEFPGVGRQMTVRHLLNHTSGLLDYEGLVPKGTVIPVLDRDVLRLLLEQERTYFVPGSKYRYSNSGYALLALIVEAASGSTFAQFLKKNIFEPLEMDKTLAYEPGLSVVPERAFGYSFKGTAFTRTDQSLTSAVLGDGGIYSSVADLHKWDLALGSSKLLNPDLLKAAFSPSPATEHPDTGYGFGWYVGTYRGSKEHWHSGDTVGFSTRIARFPEERLSVIILANRTEAKIADLPHRIADWYLFAPQ